MWQPAKSHLLVKHLRNAVRSSWGFHYLASKTTLQLRDVLSIELWRALARCPFTAQHFMEIKLFPFFHILYICVSKTHKNSLFSSGWWNSSSMHFSNNMLCVRVRVRSYGKWMVKQWGNTISWECSSDERKRKLTLCCLNKRGVEIASRNESRRAVEMSRSISNFITICYKGHRNIIIRGGLLFKYG